MEKITTKHYELFELYNREFIESAIKHDIANLLNIFDYKVRPKYGDLFELFKNNPRFNGGFIHSKNYKRTYVYTGVELLEMIEKSLKNNLGWSSEIFDNEILLTKDRGLKVQ